MDYLNIKMLIKRCLNTKVIIWMPNVLQNVFSKCYFGIEHRTP